MRKFNFIVEKTPLKKAFRRDERHKTKMLLLKQTFKHF